MNNIISQIEKIGSRKIFFFSLLLLFIIGIADYLTGQDFSFYIFYAIPVLITTWFCGRKYGLYLIIITLLFWATDNFYNRQTHIITVQPYYEISVQTLFFILIIVIFSSLKKSSEEKRALEMKKIQREMEIAREVQINMYPKFKPEINGVEYCGICYPASIVGGDYYDYIKISDDKFAFAVGDVSGHGIGPALLMAGLVGFVRSNAAAYSDNLTEFVKSVNINLCGISEESMFATFFYGILNRKDMTFTFVNAGHNPPLHYRKNKDRFDSLDTGDLFIGAITDVSFHQSAIKFEKGDLLMMYTDGVTETFNNKNEQFGEDRLKEIIKNNSDRDISDIIRTVKNELEYFSGQKPQADDITMLIIRAI